jgi:hypothetical protein
MNTITDLLNEAARPVLDAMPQRVSCRHLYVPHISDSDLERLRGPASRSPDPDDLVAEIEEHNAWMAQLRHSPFVAEGDFTDAAMEAFALMLRGPIRVTLAGVHSGSAVPLDVRCYADESAGMLWNWRPEAVDIRGWGFDRLSYLFDRVVEYLPAQPQGRAQTIYLPADAEGVISARHADRVEAVRSFLRRKRTGTYLVELLAYQLICAEYPKLGFVIIDNDLGRHVLATFSGAGADSALVLRASSGPGLAEWMEGCVEAVLTRG